MYKFESNRHFVLDCPQVRCTAVYSGQQQGELSLQLGDMINVMQKTSDGTVATQPCHSEFNKSKINEGFFFFCMLILSFLVFCRVFGRP